MISLKKLKQKLSKRENYRFHFSRIFTIAEKQIKLHLRFKFNFVYSIINPFLTIFLSLIILSRFFEMGTRFGRWDESNYYIFLFIAYNIELLRKIITDFPSEFRQEKFWKTLPALMIAPFNKLHLLFGIFISHLFIIAIPFAIFLAISYFVYPISFFTLIIVIAIYLLIDLIFSGIGLLLGVFAISLEGSWRILAIGVNVFFWFSCVTYPFEVFPWFIQMVISLNPLYYIFDILRITWLDDNIFLTMTNYPLHFLILIGTAILTPLMAMYVFNKVYTKFGVVGY